MAFLYFIVQSGILDFLAIKKPLASIFKHLRYLREPERMQKWVGQGVNVLLACHLHGQGLEANWFSNFSSLFKLFRIKILKKALKSYQRISDQPVS